MRLRALLLWAAASACGAAPDSPADALLTARAQSIPVAGIKPTMLRDSFGDGRPGRRHEAIDIAAPRGTPVFAADDGVLVKLFSSVPGGLTVYQFDPTRRLACYYAHLDRYADGLRAGMALRRCQLIGYVGSTGNAVSDAPHLHFAVFALSPAQQWWKDAVLNPYPGLIAANPLSACG